MKLQHLFETYHELNDEDLERIVRASFASVHPTANVYTKRDQPDFVISTSEEKLNDPSSLFGQGGDDFFLALNAYVYKEQADVVVSAAWAGNYKGVTHVILKNIFTRLKQISPASTQTLIADDDRSDGAWQAIATKIGVDYQGQ